MSTTTTPPLRGEKLLKAAVNQILAHPETWNQSACHCGTMHCVGGWCQILGGLPANAGNVRNDMEVLLGISSPDANWLYSTNRTLGEIYNFAKSRDRDGFDRAGFDRAGFDRAGFNRSGFDRAGNPLPPFDLTT